MRSSWASRTQARVHTKCPCFQKKQTQSRETTRTCCSAKHATQACSWFDNQERWRRQQQWQCRVNQTKPERPTTLQCYMSEKDWREDAVAREAYHRSPPLNPETKVTGVDASVMQSEEDWRQRALRTETCLCRSRHKHEIWLQQMCLNRAGRQGSSRSMPDLVPKLSMMLARFLDNGDGQITFLVLKGCWCSFLLGWSFCWGAGWWLYSRQDIRRWSGQATICRWRKIEILWNSRR